MTPTVDSKVDAASDDIAVTSAPMTFESFELSAPLMKAMNEMGFTSPTPIQQQALPLLLGDSHDFIGLASTGTGKTGAFGIPLIERINADDKNTQALVLSPTRELALQVSEQLEKLGKFKGVRVVTIYGGASYTTQISGVKKGAHIIVATPGRLIDFLEQKIIKLQHVQTVVLDEADEMISMGFKDDLETILKATHPEGAASSNRASCKTWLFSATMSSDIRRVANTYLESPKMVQINKSSGLSETVEQVYYTVKNSHKTEVIGRLLQMNPNFYGIIFCQTKMEVVGLADALSLRGFRTDSLHGDRSQKEREVTLKRFRSREVQVIVATDVAARGLDVKDLTHVVNFNLPWDTESYIHRIGRTGRNGQKGIAISLVNPEQLRSLKRIQMQTRVNMGKGKVPTADDVAMAKIKQVMGEIMAVDSTSPQFLLAQTYLEELVEAAPDFAALTKEEMLARVITAYYPQVFFKNDLQLDFVGDRIPQELLPGGRSRPPVGGRSGGYDERPRRDYGPRRDRGDRNDRGSNFGGGFEQRGEQRSERPAFRGGDRPERSASSDRPAPRREYARDDRAASAPREERPRRDYDRAPARDYDRPAPRRDDDRPRREASSGGESRAPQARGFRPFFGNANRAEGGSQPRRDDAKGVIRHRASDKKRPKYND